MPQTGFSYRGSHGLGKGALQGTWDPWTLPRADIAVNMQPNSMVPSKIPSEIEILMELLHSVRE